MVCVQVYALAGYTLIEKVEDIKGVGVVLLLFLLLFVFVGRVVSFTVAFFLLVGKCCSLLGEEGGRLLEKIWAKDRRRVGGGRGWLLGSSNESWD